MGAVQIAISLKRDPERGKYFLITITQTKAYKQLSQCYLNLIPLI